jgi:lipopolysaccharide export system protein LptA
VLVFEQEPKRLTARAETPGTLQTVHAALEDAPSAKPAAGAVKTPVKAPSRSGASPVREGVARITSSELVYLDLLRQATFTGGVRVLDASGEMRAQQATVYLTPASAGGNRSPKDATGSHAPGASAAGPAAAASGLLGGNVERIVATQHVEITQPGRRASGERLVYTASDEMFVLTGTPSVPPKVVDAQEGTTTGAALRFHSGDDSVVISGRDGDAPAQKVHTETRVKQ